MEEVKHEWTKKQKVSETHFIPRNTVYENKPVDPSQISSENAFVKPEEVKEENFDTDKFIYDEDKIYKEEPINDFQDDTQSDNFIAVQIKEEHQFEKSNGQEFSFYGDSTDKMNSAFAWPSEMKTPIETMHADVKEKNQSTVPTDQSTTSEFQFTASEDHTLPSRVTVHPPDIAEHHCRLNLPITESPEVSTPQEPFEVIKQGEITYSYTKLYGASNKSGLLVIEDCDGLQHRLVRKSRGDDIGFPEFQCEFAKNPNINCPGRLFPKGTPNPAKNRYRIVARRKEHTCTPSTLKYRTALAKKEAKSKALTTRDSALRIAETVRRKHFGEVDFEHEGEAPLKKMHFAGQVNHTRRTNNIRNPRSVGLMFNLRDHMKEVVYNDMFKKDLQVRGGARHIVLATNQMLHCLREARVWYFDATFQCVDKKLFSQLASVHCIIWNYATQTNVSIPCAFILMSRRSAPDYVAVFKALLEMVGNNGNARLSSLSRIMLDFESASWSALRSMQRDGYLDQHVKLAACFFHYTQCIWRKMGNIGELRRGYNINDTYKTFFKKVMGLGLIPTIRVEEAVEHLQSEVNRMVLRKGAADLRPRLQQLLDYVRTNLIDGCMFKHADWCAYMIAVRTNNYLEEFHSKLNGLSNKKKPSFNDLMVVLHEISEDVTLTIAELASGQYQERFNREGVERNNELDIFWRQYEINRITTGVELLKAVSEGIGKPSNDLLHFLANPDDPQGTTIEGEVMEVDNMD